MDEIQFYFIGRVRLLYINRLLVAGYAFTSCILMSFSVNEILLPWYVTLCNNLREPIFSVEMCPRLKFMESVLSTFTWRPVHLVACSLLGSRDSAWVGVFKKRNGVCIVCIHNSGVSSAFCLQKLTFTYIVHTLGALKRTYQVR